MCSGALEKRKKHEKIDYYIDENEKNMYFVVVLVMMY